MPSVISRSRPLVILGAGYTGRFLYPLAIAQGWDTRATSRTPSIHLPHIPSPHRIEFDLLRPATWSNVPEGAHLLWCFPALPQEAASQFVEQRRPNSGRLIVLGSTSAYQADPDHLIHEGTPPRLALPRVQGEEYLRTTYGAIILRLAGLYGPGRHVLDWIRRGKVKHTNRYVNLIHIEDVAGICLTALEKAKDGEVYIVSDGTPRRWSEIFSTAAERWGVPLPPLSQPKDPGKRLSIRKLRGELGYQYRFPNLFQALDEIEGQR